MESLLNFLVMKAYLAIGRQRLHCIAPIFHSNCGYTTHYSGGSSEPRRYWRRSDEAPLQIRFSVVLIVVLVWLNLTLQSACLADEVGKTFATPEEAVTSLAAAVKTQDEEALRAILGPASMEVQNPDRVQATNECLTFAAALDQSSNLNRDSENKYVLEVGTNHWPFPIPIVKQEGRWFFDTVAGQEELLNRRIGRNELATLEVVRAYVDAQREYASRDRDGDEVLEYAQRIASTPGTKDGLYWSPDLDGEFSPLGPLVARAQAEGYFGEVPIDKLSPQPYEGYLFKILTRQGKHAPGGKYSYIINGNMIGGFALVAWPAEYGHSGIMTFIVNQQGRVYQKDLGAKTGKIAAKMDTYDPDSSWQISAD